MEYILTRLYTLLLRSGTSSYTTKYLTKQQRSFSCHFPERQSAHQCLDHPKTLVSARTSYPLPLLLVKEPRKNGSFAVCPLALYCASAWLSAPDQVLSPFLKACFSISCVFLLLHTSLDFWFVRQSSAHLHPCLLTCHPSLAVSIPKLGLSYRVCESSGFFSPLCNRKTLIVLTLN